MEGEPVERREDADDLATLAERRAESIDLPTFIGSAMATTRGLGALIPPLGGIPVNTTGIALLSVLAFLRRPKWRVGYTLLVWAAFGLLAWLIFTTVVINDITNIRRIGNIVVLGLIAAVIGSGRLHFRSLQSGLFLGYLAALLISMGMRFALGGGGAYGGRLTGVLGDPNAAGYILVTLGFAIAQGFKVAERRWYFLAIFGFGIWLTVSRTTMFSALVAILWVLLAKRIGRIVTVAGLAGVMWLYGWAKELMEARGLFTEREGSDALRERLLVVEQAQVAEAGWWGNGLGTAVADLDNITLFFHNSYLAMQAEGGLIGLWLLYAIMLGLFLMLHKLPPSERPIWAEAGVVAGFICSINIGFSLTSPAIAVAIGLLIYHHCEARERIKASAIPEHYEALRN